MRDRGDRVCPGCRTEPAGEAADELCPRCSRRTETETERPPRPTGADLVGAAELSTPEMEAPREGARLAPALAIPAADPGITPPTRDPAPPPVGGIPTTMIAVVDAARREEGGGGDPIDFGDYELQGEIARGGMGVVYRARQVSLNRVVALKVILRGGLATGDDVQRFLLEAEAAANLDHPNIVPIYEVGEHRGRHYFSMKLIEGGSLSGRIRSLIDDPRSAARLLAATARGVHAAHQRGILHRDLKPANILVDHQGQPRVTDFGLAKRVEGDSGLTQSGAIIGTPSYMAPEQAAGHNGSLTTAADVYGLGAVLYELLTGRPPFRGPTPVDTLMQVLDQEPVRPRALRGGVDPDLETICLKCLEKDARRRYGSAEGLADDLDRWLRGEPILARPCSTRERVLKWARRRPAIAAMIGLTAMAITLGLGAALWGWRVAEGQWRVAEGQRSRADRKAVEAGRSAAAARLAERDAKKQQERAEQGFRQLRGALDQFFTQVSESNLLNQPGLQPLRKSLLQAALENYQQILRQWGDDPDVRVDLGKARLRLALVTGEIDSWPKAIILLEQARSTFEGLSKARPRTAEYRALLAKSDNGLGILYAATGRMPDAEARLREALAILSPLVEEDPGHPDHRRDLARTRHNLGRLCYALERRREAEAYYKSALEIEGPSGRAPGADFDARRDLAKTLNNLGDVLLNGGKDAEAEAAYTEALRLRAGLVADQPAPLAQNDLATSHASLGVLHYAGGGSAAARDDFRRAIAIWEPLVKDNPAVTQFRRNLAAACNNLGVLHNADRSYVEAEAPFRRALELEEKLARDDPDELYREATAASRNNLGLVYASSGRGREAAAEFEAARKIREDLSHAHPEPHPRSRGYRRDLAATYSNLGFQHRIAGRATEAVTAYRAALDLRRGLVSGSPEEVRYRIDLAANLGDLGLCHRVARQAAEAEAAYKEAAALRHELSRDRPGDLENRRGLAAVHHGLGLLHRDAGAPAESEAAFARALAIRAQLCDSRPDDAELRAELGATHDALGALHLQSGRSAEAEAAYRSALAVRRRLARDRPRDPDARRELAATYNALGVVHGAARRAAAAEAAFLQAREAAAGLAAERPGDLECAVDLAGYDANLAEQLHRGGKQRAALEAYDRAILVLEPSVGREGCPPEARAFLRNALWGRAEVRARQGQRARALDDWGRAIEADPGLLRPAIRADRAVALARWGRYAQAVAEADDLAREPSLSAAALLNLARAYALATALAFQDADRPEAERRRSSDRHAAIAVELLGRARAGGLFDDPARARALKDDPDFNPLRGRRAFRAFLPRESPLGTAKSAR